MSDASYELVPIGRVRSPLKQRAEAPKQGYEGAPDARIEIETLLAVYAVPRISQVQLMYRARLITDDVSAGPESLEVGLFEFDRIPWDDIAFPSVRWALHQFQESRHLDSFAAYTNPPGETGDF